MRAEFINPLLESTKNVFQSTLNLNVDVREPFVRRATDEKGSIGVCVGITGKIRGQVVFSMKEEVALRIASTMMMMEVQQLDEVSRSAISEICNMIMGSTAADLFESNISIDITPPAFLKGENLTYLGTNKVETLCIPLVLNEELLIEVEVFVAKDD